MASKEFIAVSSISAAAFTRFFDLFRYWRSLPNEKNICGLCQENEMHISGVGSASHNINLINYLFQL
jgi:hypothetical protein